MLYTISLEVLKNKEKYNQTAVGQLLREITLNKEL